MTTTTMRRKMMKKQPSKKKPLKKLAALLYFEFSVAKKYRNKNLLSKSKSATHAEALKGSESR